MGLANDSFIDIKMFFWHNISVAMNMLFELYKFNDLIEVGIESDW